MKKLLSMLLLTGLLLFFCGGFLLGQEVSNKETEDGCWGEIEWLDEKLSVNQDLIVISPEAPQGKVSETDYQVYEYAYTQLNQAEQMAYREIVSSIQKNRWNKYVEMGNYRVVCVVDLSKYRLNENELVETYWSVLCDHIEMFYVKGDFCGYINNEETLLYVLAAETDKDGMEQYDVFTALNMFESKALSGVRNEDDSEQKIRHIFDYVMDNLSYAEDSNAKPVVNDITSSLACIVKGQGICSGYAKVFTYLCNCVDVPAIYVTGYTDQGYHAWTYVNIGDMWYACDVTYSDYGTEIFLKGKEAYSTHQPIIYGVNTYGFSYPYPELSERDYCLLFEEENREKAEIVDSESENRTEEENVQGDTWEDECAENKAEMREENQNIVSEKVTTESIDLTQDKEQKIQETEAGDTSEEVSNTYPNQDPEINISHTEDETKIQIEGETASVESTPSIPKDTIYLLNGEPYINGMPADLYYIFKAQDSPNDMDKIAYYKEALIYAPDDDGLYYNLGVYYARCNDYDNALYYYLQAIEKGDTTGAVDNVIHLIEGSGKMESEKELAYQSVLGLVPNDARVLNLIKN